MSTVLQRQAANLDDADIQVAIEPLPDLEWLAPIWQALEKRADRSFFLSWLWIGTWLATIDCRPELITARLNGEIVGLGLVHARVKIRHRVLPVWTLYLNQTGNDDQDVITIEYNDILADRTVQDRVRHACLRFMIEHGGIGEHEVGELVLGGFVGDRRAEIEAFGRPVQERASDGSAFVDLAAMRAAKRPFLETLKPKTARRIRRSIALYEERGGLKLEEAKDVDQALSFFESCGALHQTRWTARGRPGAFAYPFYIAFHRRLIAKALPLGKVELVRVSVDSEPIGFLYNFVDRGRVNYYFSGFRFEQDNRLKPGLVCHSLCIERHRAADMDVYDFMGGDQRYKRELGQPGPDIVCLAVQRPNWMLAAERPLRRFKQALDGLRLSPISRDCR
ncbi:MAG: GNAT family N-acetyltransferase [Pseudomonadota bacterium]